MKTFFVTILALLLLNVYVHSDELAEQQARLEALASELSRLQESLVEQQRAVSNQQRALQAVEKNLSETQSNIRQRQQEIDGINRAIMSRQNEIEAIELRLVSKADQIESILRVAYKQNNQPLIKLLLSNERPEDYARQLYYFARVTEQQRSLLQEWLQDQSDLKLAESELALKKTQLAEGLADLNAQQDQLQLQQNQRTQALSNLQLQASSTEQKIAAVEAERVALTELVAALEAKLAEFSIEDVQVGDIRTSKGQLPWPVNGRLQNSYNARMDDTSVRWQGYWITASAGEPVRAVHAGQVIFADFFRTNGLLLILDHGNGVMTLYGRNQSLLKEVGTWVNAGDIIAEVGQTGGHERNGLYFEVRNNGQPENPANWLVKR